MSKLGKQLAHALRHDPKTYGLALDSEGAIPVAKLSHALKVTTHDIINEVQGDDKGRFGILDDENGSLRIYARYGHSIPNGVSLEEFTGYSDTDKLYHGTVGRNKESIKLSGLRPMQREHVHLSLVKEEALHVGARHLKSGDTIVLYSVLARDLAKAKIKMFKSENGLVMVNQVPSELIELEDVYTMS